MGFVVSTLLLIVIIISVTQAVMKWPPLIKDRTTQNALVSRASALNKILLETPGAPPNWGVFAPISLGLAEYNNFSNMSVIGSLDARKLEYANNSLTYFAAKSLLSMDNDTDFYLMVSNSTHIFGEIRGPLPGSSSNVVSINRAMMVNGSEANTTTNVTLLVW